MTWNSLIYKIKTDIKPFKTAVFTVMISVMASICISVVSEAGKQIMSEEMNSMGMNGLAAVAYNSIGENVTDEKLFFNICNMSDTQNASPIITENTSAVFENGISMSFMCWGIGPEITEVISLETLAGRMINDVDVERKSRICLIDEKAANAVYKRNNICGKKILVNIGETSAEFTVVGTVRKNSNILNSITGDVIPDFIYIPYSTMMDLSTKTAFDQIIFESDNNNQNSEKLKNSLSKINTKYSNQVIRLTNLSEQKEQITKIVDTAFLSLFLVSCITILVCSLSIAASVNTAVISKKKDIGIKISMGASDINIISEFLISAVMSCMAGIAAAIVIMMVILKAIEITLSINLDMDYNLIAISIFVTIMLTTFFSFLPSSKAAKMPPIKALNRE